MPHIDTAQGADFVYPVTAYFQVGETRTRRDYSTLDELLTYMQSLIVNAVEKSDRMVGPVGMGCPCFLSNAFGRWQQLSFEFQDTREPLFAVDVTLCMPISTSQRVH